MQDSTFGHIDPSAEQIEVMARVRAAAATFAEVLEAELPEGPDRTWVIRNHRTTAMWANFSITRHSDGTPR